MLKRIRTRLTFANTVSVIALFAALGLGTAWALERNSVESKHIVNDQVKPADIAGLKALEHTGDVRVSDNNTDTDPTDVELASARGFEFTGRCLDLGGAGTNTAIVLVEPKDPDTTWSFDSTAHNGDDNQTGLTGTSQATVIRVGPLPDTHFEGGAWALRSDAGGDDRGPSLHGLVAASIETTRDCTFSLTILG